MLVGCDPTAALMPSFPSSRVVDHSSHACGACSTVLCGPALAHPAVPVEPAPKFCVAPTLAYTYRSLELHDFTLGPPVEYPDRPVVKGREHVADDERKQHHQHHVQVCMACSTGVWMITSVDPCNTGLEEEQHHRSGCASPACAVKGGIEESKWEWSVMGNGE